MGKLVYSTWLATVRQQGTRMAIREADGTNISFEELQNRVEKRLDLLSGEYCWRNRVVAFQLENSIDWLEAFLTCQAMEAIALPFDLDVPSDGLESILSIIRPAALWTKTGIQALKNRARRLPACLIKLTSGSTGLPRPLLFEDTQMLADGKQVCSTMGIQATDANLAIIPFGHSYGLGNLVMPLVLYGSSIAICQDPFPYSIVRTINEAGVTVVPAVPAILKSLVASGVNREDLQSVRLLISAGSPFAAKDARLFCDKFGKHVHNFYGSSETGGIAYDREGHETLSGRSVGTPLDGVSVSLTASGRLQVTSKAVFVRGNHRRSRNQGVHVLADLASISEDGHVSLSGRCTRMVKIDGKRVNLGEIERRLLEIEEVDGARVIEFSNPQGRIQLAAAVFPEVPADRICDALKSCLPAWKIPDKFIPLPQFPLTGRGKVNLRKLDKLLRD